MGELSGYLPGGNLSWTIPGVPRHLQGMLGGGILGAGLGYGAGWLGSGLLPRKCDRERLPKTLAVLGGLAGAAPGVLAMGSNALDGRSVLDDELFQAPPNELKWYQTTRPDHTYGPHSEYSEPNPDYDPGIQIAMPSDYRKASAALAEVTGEDLHPLLKSAVSQTGYELSLPLIPVDQFRRDMEDPRVAGRLPMPMRGLVDSAWYARPDRDPGHSDTQAPSSSTAAGLDDLTFCVWATTARCS